MSSKKSKKKAHSQMQGQPLKENREGSNTLTKKEIVEKLERRKEEREALERERMRPFEGGATFGNRFEASTVLFAIISAMFAVFFFKMGMHDWDFLWHAKLGEYIASNASFPHTDIFSWIGIEREMPYTAHSWVFSVFVGSLTTIGFPPYVAASIVSALAAFTLYLFVKTTLFPRRNFLSLLLAMILGFLCANPRPGIWGYVLFVYVLILLQTSLEKKNAKSWVTLPIVSLIWANIHGGTVLILLCIEALYFLIGLMPNFKVGFLENNTVVGWDINLLKAKGEDGKLKSLGELRKSILSCNNQAFKNYWWKGFLYLSGSILLALANPYGRKTLVWGFTENNSATKMFVNEWQPIKLNEPCVLLVICILIVYALMFYKGGVKLHKIMPAICCLGAAAVYQRFVAYAVLASLLPLSDIVKKTNKKGWVTWKWYAVVVPLTLAMVVATSSFEGMNKNTYELDKDLDAYLKEARFERPYTEHDEGGKLIYAGYKTFVDSRFTNELLVDAILLQGLKARGGKTVGEFMDEMRFDSLVLSKDDSSPLILYLEMQPSDWKLGFENDRYVVFVKKDSNTKN